MKRMWGMVKSKGFYIALGTGLLAFATLIAVYNYQNTKDDLTKEQAIDLNQPVANEDELRKEDETQLANSDGAQAATKDDSEKEQTTEKPTEQRTEVTTEEAAKQPTEEANEQTGDDALEGNDTIPATSDGASANPANDLIAGLEYDGEQILTWPLIGNVILPYSMDTTVYFQTLDTYKCNPGILIQGEEGSDVMAAYEGVVTSVEESREYGTVVKINMGNGYEATYGQLMNVCVNVNDNVAMAQNIAEVGPVSSYYFEEGPHLFFEITKDGVPINPMTLIK